MMRKVFIMVCIAMTSIMKMQAQKIDQRLTELVQQPAALYRTQAQAINHKALTDRIDVTLNVDGTVSSMSAIATLTENGTKPGRAVISSCGNAGSRYQSIVKTLSTTDEELKTVLGAISYPTPEEPYLTVSYYYRYMMYADDYQDFTPRVMLVNLKTGELIGEEDLDKVGLDDTDIPTLEKKTVVRLNGEEAVTYSFNLRICEIENADYRYALIVKAGHDGQTIKMVCNGDNNDEPCFFAPPSVDGSYDFAANGYTNGDGTIAFNTSVCDESVISVGAYVTRSEWTNYLGEVMHNPTSALTLKPPMGTARLHPPQCTLWMLPSIT